MTREEFKLQKATALAESIKHTAQGITKSLSQAFPRKNAFRKDKYCRAPIRRINKARAMATVGITGFLGACQINHILSQPFPKFPEGRPNIISAPKQAEIVVLDKKYTSWITVK